MVKNDQIIWPLLLLVEPTGLLVDTAMRLIFDVIEKVSNRERREALLRASRHTLMRGVTTVVDRENLARFCRYSVVPTLALHGQELEGFICLILSMTFFGLLAYRHKY